MIFCPNCGELSISEIYLYNQNIRKQDFNLLPILPTCKHCNAEVTNSHICNSGNIIVLNGTCGSGKSTVAEILENKGFLAIDGDCVIQVVKHKKNIKHVDFREIYEEIALQIDVLSLFTKNFVLSNVIVPGDLDICIKIFEARNIKYRFILLKPDYQTAVQRCQTRTCHTSITPEYWIKYFYDLLVFDNRVEVVDNTNMTVDETAEYILQNKARNI